jgi:protein involved in polysaccharide export with SLBB domain
VRIRNFFLLVGLLLVGVAGAMCQEKLLLGGGDELEMLSKLKAPSITTPQDGVALESTVDPTRYYVGPSDVIAVNIWVSPPLNYTLTVTPEGTLIIPTVGEVVVADLLLSDAKTKVFEAIRKKYLTGQFSVTLVKPRPIIVSVLGTVLHPGLYTLTSVARANKAIEEANRPTQKEFASDAVRYQDEMSTRSIVLRHKDGTQQRVDIARFFATREDIWNPYLREGDVLVVPRKNLTKNVFGIYGEVNAPGRYEFVQGDSVLDALRMGQGFTRLALSDSVEFSRLNSDGTTLSTSIINLRAIRDRQQLNLAIEPGDRIVVKGKIDLREDYRIAVYGEVAHPGVYPITKNTTRLTDVIRMAGGFTEFAWLENAELNRRSIGADELNLERLISLRGGASQEDSAYYLLETDLRLRKEIVNVDFDRLFVHGDSTQNVLVQSEDYIYVPSRKKTIYVFGQVVTSGHVPFVPSEGVDYYINKAGGFTDRAREGDLKIVKAKTRQWLSPNETKIEEGDYVWVPKEIERPFSYYMNIIGQTASIISVGVSVVLLVIQINK